MTLDEFRKLGHKARWKNTTKEQRSAAARHAALARAEQAEAELAQIAAAAERRRQDIHEYLTAQMKATGDKDYDAAQ